MCKQDGENARNVLECCYNHYFNGLTCKGCTAGFTGLNCSNTCNKDSYGHLCSIPCNCPKDEICHHINGCQPGEYTSLRTTNDFFSHSGNSDNTIYFTTNSNTVTRENNNASVKAGNHITTVITHSKGTQSSMSTTPTDPGPRMTSAGNVPGPGGTPNNNNSTILVVIGGIIGLFLGLLVIQMCVKILMSRKKKRKHKHIKTESVKEEETYQEINEAIMVISKADDETGNSRQLKKYHELKTVNSDNIIPYQTIRFNSNNQTVGLSVNENTVELKSLSTSSDSTKSNDSYLKPTTNIFKRHNYIDVVEENKCTGGSLRDLKEKGNPKTLTSSLYVEPVQVGVNAASLPGLLDDNNTYLSIVK